MDLEKLTKDCIAAKNAAIAAASQVDDGGSCNLDSTFLALEKGVRATRIVGAITAAGLRAYPADWHGRGIMITSPVAAQAYKRYAANTALADSLRAAGWPVTPYYQMD